MNMEPLIPHSLLEDDDYQVFLELISIVHDDIKGMIAEFPELVDIDNAPEIFLPKLSALIRYRYRYDIDEDIQREIIKRIISIYRDRGTDDAISMAATYGDDPDWIGSHVFLPGANTNKDRAQVTHPVEEIFRHDISKHSGTHRFADAVRWRDGTLIIKASKINDDIRAAIKKVIPAGLRVYFDLINNSPGDGYFSELTFGEWTLSVDYELDYDMVIKDKLEVATFDVRGNGRRLRSGRQIVFSNYELEYGIGSSMIPTEDKFGIGNTILADAKPSDLVMTTDRSGNFFYSKLSNLDKMLRLRATRNQQIINVSAGQAKLTDLIVRDNSQIEDLVIANSIIHRIDYTITGFDLLTRHQGIPARSTSRAARSGRYAYDGTYTGEIFMQTEIREVTPQDVRYPVSVVESLKVHEYLKDYTNPVEIVFEPDPTPTSVGDLTLDSIIVNKYSSEVFGEAVTEVSPSNRSGDYNPKDLLLSDIISKLPSQSVRVDTKISDLKLSSKIVTSSGVMILGELLNKVTIGNSEISLAELGLDNSFLEVINQ